ncbi:MAG: Bug family tripartite tricarboxylate transporter substrate binding protein [Betaproteobacteria bacterium]
MKRSTAMLVAIAASASVLFGAAEAFAQPFPSRPLKITLGFGPGSGPDIFIRLIGDRMSRELGRPVVIDNRPGGSGIISMEAGKKGIPDGHDLTLADGGDLAINRHAFRKIPYDPQQDFVPIVLVWRATFFLIVSSQLPLQSAKDVIAHAKAKPNELTFASFGVAHTTRLAMEQFKAAAGGLEITHVPFRESTQLVAAVSSGEVSMVMTSTATATAGLQTGRMRLVAVGSLSRLPTHPGVPTIAESGGPTMEASAWVGLMAPRGTPREAIVKLNSTMQKVLADSTVQERLTVAGLQAGGGSPEDFAALIRAEDERYGAAVRALKIQLD